MTVADMTRQDLGDGLRVVWSGDRRRQRNARVRARLLVVGGLLLPRVLKRR